MDVWAWWLVLGVTEALASKSLGCWHPEGAQPAGREPWREPWEARLVATTEVAGTFW